MSIRIRTQGVDQLARLIARMDRHSYELPFRLEDALRGTARPVVSAVGERVLGIEIGSSRGGTAPPNVDSGLRERLAAAVGTCDIDDGVRIEVDGSVVDPEWGARLAQLTDVERAPRWHYPVFGNRSKWEENLGEPWFGVTIRAAEERFENGVERVMERTANAIMRGTA